MEFTGPLTVDAFLFTKSDQLAVIPQTVKNRVSLGAEFDALTNIFDSLAQAENTEGRSTVRDNPTIYDMRVIIQSEQGADGKSTPVKIFVGQYVDRPAAVQGENLAELATQAIGTEPALRGKYINVDSVHDLKTDEIYNIAARANISAIVIPLSNEGYLMQPEADKLVAKAKELEQLLDISKPQKSGDGKSTVEINYADGDSDRVTKTSDRLLRDFNDILDGGTTKVYGATVGDKAQLLDTVVDNGKFTRALTVTGEDGVSRILLGKKEDAQSVDKVTGVPVDRLVFTHSFNAQDGKTSPLEKPVELPVSDGHTRQENIDAVVNQVQEAVKKNEISLAPRGKNPEFDALLRDADKVALGYDGAAPATPSATKSKVASVA